jgi:hypothetical protein
MIMEPASSTVATSLYLEVSCFMVSLGSWGENAG